MRIYLIGCMPEGKNSDLEERIMKILQKQQKTL